MVQTQNPDVSALDFSEQRSGKVITFDLAVVCFCYMPLLH